MPVKLLCPDCQITVTGRFAVNEFAALAEDDLHFLRIFILCEGRIRDMESALGVSYPTIKAHLAHLKATLAASQKEPPLPAELEAGASARPPAENAAAAVLKELETGRITYDQAMERLQTLPKESP